MSDRDEGADRHEVEVRPLEAADADALRAFFGAVPEGDRMFFRHDVFAEGVVDDPGAHRFVAVDGDDVVGSLAIRPGAGWSSHVGGIDIVVDPSRRRQGIGRALARAALIRGVELGLDKLVVEVVAVQESTVALFAALGFEPEALLRGHVRDSAGDVQDLLVMAHFVASTWAVMETTGISELVEG